MLYISCCREHVASLCGKKHTSRYCASRAMTGPDCKTISSGSLSDKMIHKVTLTIRPRTVRDQCTIPMSTNIDIDQIHWTGSSSSFMLQQALPHHIRRLDSI